MQARVEVQAQKSRQGKASRGVPHTWGVIDGVQELLSIECLLAPRASGCYCWRKMDEAMSHQLGHVAPLLGLVMRQDRGYSPSVAGHGVYGPQGQISTDHFGAPPRVRSPPSG